MSSPANPPALRRISPVCTPTLMRAGQRASVRPRCAATVAASAAAGESNSAKKESPAVSSTEPPFAAIACSRIAWCFAIVSNQAGPSSRASAVEPSTSVKTIVASCGPVTTRL